MSTDLLPAIRPPRVTWNKGRIIGPKPTFSRAELCGATSTKADV